MRRPVASPAPAGFRHDRAEVRVHMHHLKLAIEVDLGLLSYASSIIQSSSSELSFVELRGRLASMRFVRRPASRGLCPLSHAGAAMRDTSITLCRSRPLHRCLSWKKGDWKWRCVDGRERTSTGSNGGAVCVVRGRVCVSGTGQAKRRFGCESLEWVSRPARLVNAGQVDGRSSGFNVVGTRPVAPTSRVTLSQHQHVAESERTR